MIFAHGMDVLGLLFFFFSIGEGMARHCIANGALFGLSIVLKERYLRFSMIIQFGLIPSKLHVPGQRNDQSDSDGLS